MMPMAFDPEHTHVTGVTGFNSHLLHMSGELLQLKFYSLEIAKTNLG